MLRGLCLVASAVLALVFSTPVPAEPAAPAVADELAPATQAPDEALPAGVESRNPNKKGKQAKPSTAKKPPSAATSSSSPPDADSLAVPAAKPALRPKRKDATPEADQAELAEPAPPRRKPRPLASSETSDESDEGSTDEPPPAPRRRPAADADSSSSSDVDPATLQPIRRWKPGRFTGGEWETVAPLPTRHMDPSARKPNEELGYLSPDEQRAARAHVGKKRNQLTREDGKPLDTGGAKELYVIDPQGNLFISNSRLRQGREQFYHSSFLSGGDVAAAGWIEVRKGKITYIDNMSGHYKPSVAQLQSAEAHLRAQGVSASRMDVVASPQSLMAAPPPPRPMAAGAGAAPAQ